jgi:hypothetical protein
MQICMQMCVAESGGKAISANYMSFRSQAGKLWLDGRVSRFRLHRLGGRRQNHIPSPPTPPPTARALRRYLPLPLLRDLSKRTGVPISSLGVSFLLLHELSAVVPVVGLYFLFDALGAGQALVDWIRSTGGLGAEADIGEIQSSVESNSGGAGVLSDTVSKWYDEGERRVEKVGRKYGFWGFEKGSMAVDGAASEGTGTNAAQGIANAISAYVVVKVGSAMLYVNLIIGPPPRTYSVLYRGGSDVRSSGFGAYSTRGSAVLSQAVITGMSLHSLFHQVLSS